MTDQANLIVQLAPDCALDQNLLADPPASLSSGRVVLDHVAAGEDGRLGPPEAGEIILSVLSPEALRREPELVRDVIRRAPAAGEPPVIIVETAEELREDELGVVADAADRSHRTVILRVLSDP
jgi:hypothetical protein